MLNHLRITTQSLACALAMLLAPVSLAHSPTTPREIREAPAELAVRKELPPAPAGVTELRFRDLIKMPIGSRGLEASDLLRANDGKRVRIVGFMVQQAEALPGRFLLSPLPVAISDDDEGLADDVPPAIIEIELADAHTAMPHMPGLLQISGTLEVGAKASDANPRISFARIKPDARTAKALARVAQATPSP